MRRARWRMVLAVAAAAMAVPAGAQDAPPERSATGQVVCPPAPATRASPRTLRVSGEGRAQAAPDVAVASFAVTAFDASLGKATRAAAEAARRVHGALEAAGIARKDLQTSRYDVQIERRAPRSSEPPRVTGYRVTNELRVKVRDLSKLGPILDQVVAAGANEVQGLAFTKDDPSAERSLALAAAVRDARAKAEDMARTAGVRLGEVLELVEGGHTPVPMPRMMSMAAAEGVPVQPGEIEILAHVEMTFAVL